MNARFVLLATLFLATLLLAPAGRHRSAVADEAPKVDRAAVERRVRADLDAAYAAFVKEEKTWLPPYAEEVRALASDDAARRAEAGTYLAILVTTTDADAREHRTPPRGGWSIGGPQDVGDEVRMNVAMDLARARWAGTGAEALEAALWLATKDRLDALRVAGARAVVRIHHPDADAAIVAWAREPHPTYEVLEAALAAIGERKLAAAEDAVRALCLHHRSSVAAAARTAAAALDLSDLPARDPAAALPPQILARLADLAACVADPVPPGTPWRRFAFAKPRSFDFDDWGGSSERAGWLLSSAEGTLRILDAFGHRFEAAASDTRIIEETLAQSARSLLAARKDAFDPPNEDKQGAFVERVGRQSFVVHQGPWNGSLPEVLIAAWCAASGEADAARDLVMPLLAAHHDERGLFDLAFDQLASRLDRDMLDAFTNRDYDRALALATHIATPRFASFWAQGRAKELAVELPRRRDDFDALALPKPDAWAKQRATLSREAQIAFLAARLRLIHDKQYDIPGGVNWGAEQFARPLTGLAWGPQAQAERARNEVINPYVELRRMNLSGDDLLGLIPHLESEDHILAYDLPRFMPHWPRSLHRVRWLVASIVDDVLGDEATDRRLLEGDDAAARRGHLEALARRAKDLGAGTEADRRERELLSGSDDREIQEALARLGVIAPSRGARVLLKRAGAEPARRGEWVRLAYALDAADAVAAAAPFACDPDPDTAFWASALLLRHGNPKQRSAGRDFVLATLSAGDPHVRIDVVLDDLLATRDPRVDHLLGLYLVPCAGPTHPPTIRVLQAGLLRGRQDAYDRLRAGVEGREVLSIRVYDEGGGWNPSGPWTPDHLARQVLAWSPTHVGEDDVFGAEDPKVAAARAERAAKALQEAFQAAAKGSPPNLDRPPRPLPLGRWGWVSSGWVLRTR